MPPRDMTINADYGSSDLYSGEDMDQTIAVIDSECRNENN